jgi:hypothetical protein
MENKSNKKLGGLLLGVGGVSAFFGLASCALRGFSPVFSPH